MVQILQLAKVSQLNSTVVELHTRVLWLLEPTIDTVFNLRR